MLITVLFVIVFIISASLCYKFRNHDVSMALLLLAVICAVGLIVCGACTPFDTDVRTQDAMDKERMLLELRINDDYWRKDARLTAELVHDVDEYNELVISMRDTYNSEWTSWFGRSWMADLTTVEFPEGGWK